MVGDRPQRDRVAVTGWSFPVGSSRFGRSPFAVSQYSDGAEAWNPHRRNPHQPNGETHHSSGAQHRGDSRRTGVSAAVKHNGFPAAGGLYPDERDDGYTHREKMTMDIKEKIDALRSGELSRRDFNTALSAVGVSLVVAPMASRKAAASSPRTSNSPMCETSNSPTLRRTAWCSAMMPS